MRHFKILCEAIATVFVIGALPCWAAHAPIHWLGGDPITGVHNRSRFPFVSAGQPYGILLLTEDPKSPAPGHISILRNNAEQTVDDVNNGHIKAVGLIQLSSATDSIILQASRAESNGRYDEALVWLDPRTGERVWLRVDSTTGEPVHSISTNYTDPKFTAERQLLEELRIKRFPVEIPKRRS